MRVYRASALGSCTKAQAAVQLGYAPVEFTDATKEVFAEGDLHEGAVVERLVSEGYTIEDQQQEVVLSPSSDSAWCIEGHIDGILINGSRRLLEIKSMSDASYKKMLKTLWDTPGLMQKYKWQVSFYMGMLQLPGVLVCKNRNSGTVYHLPIDEPFYTLEQITARVESIEAMVVGEDLPVDCELGNDFFCAVPYLHEGDGAKVEVPASDLPVIDELGKRYLEYRRQESKYRDDAKEVAQEIIKELGPVKKVETVRGLQVSVYQRTTTKLNRDKIKADGIDLGPYMETSLSDETARITMRKEG